MAVNVSERAATLEDVLAMLRAQAARVPDSLDTEPLPGPIERAYAAGKMYALAEAIEQTGTMMHALWPTNTGDQDETTCAT